jgi:hypothetical protein
MGTWIRCINAVEDGRQIEVGIYHVMLCRLGGFNSNIQSYGIIYDVLDHGLGSTSKGSGKSAIEIRKSHWFANVGDTVPHVEGHDGKV